MTQEQYEQLAQMCEYTATMFAESYQRAMSKGATADTALHFATTMLTTTLSAMYAQSQPKSEEKALADFVAMMSHGSKGQ